MEILQLGIYIGGGVVLLIVIIISIILCRRRCSKNSSLSLEEKQERESLVSLQEMNGKEGLMKENQNEPENNNIEVNTIQVTEEKPKLRAVKKEQKQIEKKEEPPIEKKEEIQEVKKEEIQEEKKEEIQEEKKEEKTIYDEILSINDNTKIDEENSKKKDAENERDKNLDSEEQKRRDRLKTIAEANEDMRESFYDKNPPNFNFDIAKEYDKIDNKNDNEEIPVEPENNNETKTESTQEEQKKEEIKQEEPKQEINNENVINNSEEKKEEEKKEEEKKEEKKEEEKKEKTEEEKKREEIKNKKFPQAKKSFRRLNSDSAIGAVKGDDTKGVEERKSRMLKRLNKARSRAKDAEEEKRRPKKSESIQKKATLYQEKLFHNLSLVDKDD